jgi:cytochrome P450
MRIQYQNLKGFSEHLDELVNDLSLSSGVVDLQPLFFRFTLATTTALIFGQKVSNLDNERQDTFANSFDYASLICALRLRLADFYWIYTPSKYSKACKIVQGFVEGFIDQALSEKDNNESPNSSRYTFIYELHDELKDRLLVRDQLTNVLIAGRDTTACLMSWTL